MQTYNAALRTFCDGNGIVQDINGIKTQDVLKYKET